MDALILSGGKNSRMNGRYKGDLKLNTETFVDILISQMRGIADHIYLSYGEVDHGEKVGCVIVRDLHPGCGPISGLEAGLSVCATSHLLVAACDMPFLREDFFRLLLARGEEEQKRTGRELDCVVPVLHGRPDVLAAVYGRTVLPFITRQIEKGIYRPRAVLEMVNTLYVPVDDRPEYAAMLRNINTPEDYEEAARLSCGRKDDR